MKRALFTMLALSLFAGLAQAQEFDTMEEACQHYAALGYDDKGEGGHWCGKDEETGKYIGGNGVGVRTTIDYVGSVGEILYVDPIAANTFTVTYSDECSGGVCVTSLYNVNDVVWALETALELLGQYDSGPTLNYPVYHPPSDALRSAADMIEQRERDLAKIRDILSKLR